MEGRSLRQHLAAGFRDAIEAYLAGRELESPQNVADLHSWLKAEHGYPGSLRSVERYVRANYPAPAVRARRRVETPPGAQAQADWAAFPGVWVGRGPCDLLLFELELSHSRMDTSIWSERKDQLAWLHVHNEALPRLGGVPASIRVDNEKTAVVRGAGAWGVVNPVYRRYAETLRFHIDLCPPREPQAKGKVERRIRDRRSGVNPYARRWRDLAELQAHTDERGLESAHRRRCPATGTDVYTAWLEERPHLGRLPDLPAPFDVVLERRVGRDCTLQFEGRTYSVPFRFLGQRVEVRGTATHVEVFAAGECVARHVRHSRSRIVLDEAHFAGPATATVLPPAPLGRFGRRLAEIAALAPQRRPLDLYAALAEVAR
jgi:transposase